MERIKSDRKTNKNQERIKSIDFHDNAVRRGEEKDVAKTTTNQKGIFNECSCETYETKLYKFIVVQCRRRK